MIIFKLVFGGRIICLRVVFIFVVVDVKFLRVLKVIFMIVWLGYVEECNLYIFFVFKIFIVFLMGVVIFFFVFIVVLKVVFVCIIIIGKLIFGNKVYLRLFKVNNFVIVMVN